MSIKMITEVETVPVYYMTLVKINDNFKKRLVDIYSKDF